MLTSMVLVYILAHKLFTSELNQLPAWLCLSRTYIHSSRCCYRSTARNNIDFVFIFQTRFIMCYIIQKSDKIFEEWILAYSNCCKILIQRLQLTLVIRIFLKTQWRHLLGTSITTISKRARYWCMRTKCISKVFKNQINYAWNSKNASYSKKLYRKNV